MDDMQLDLATAILRMEQAEASPDSRDFLVHRLATCDAPRLREYLDADTMGKIGQWMTGPTVLDDAAVAARTRSPEWDNYIEVFRQAGGCLEIRDTTHVDEGGQPDLVHICQPRDFVTFLEQFINDTPNLH